MQAPKNGFFYVLDRATGELLSADPYAVTNWAKNVDLKTGRPVVESAARYSESGNSFVAMPGPAEAIAGNPWRSVRNWVGLHSGDRAGISVLPGEEHRLAPAGLEHRSRFQCRQPAAGPQNQGFHQERTEGTSRGMDPVGARRGGGRARAPWNGGVLSTAGNLVFKGTAWASSPPTAPTAARSYGAPRRRPEFSRPR